MELPTVKQPDPGTHDDHDHDPDLKRLDRIYRFLEILFIVLMGLIMSLIIIIG